MRLLAIEPDVIMRRGKPVSVILPIKLYEELIERLEDAVDVAYLMKARTKPLSFRPLKDFLAEEEALKQGMEAKSKEFVEKGAEVYEKV